MGVILMSLNMASLETLWQTNAAGVSIVISSLGIGRLSVLLLQDYYPIALVAALLSCSGCAAIWPSFGILHTNNIIIAYVLASGGNGKQFSRCRHLSQFDGSFPRSPGTANILIKAFVSSGQFYYR